MRAISGLSTALSLPSSGLSFTDLLRCFAFCRYVGGKDQGYGNSFFFLVLLYKLHPSSCNVFLEVLEAPCMEKEITDHGN